MVTQGSRSFHSFNLTDASLSSMYSTREIRAAVSPRFWNTTGTWKAGAEVFVVL
jgi:hypothetical protein